MRRLLATTLIVTALPLAGLSPFATSGQAQAQERPSLLTYLTFDSLFQRFAQTAVMGLRTQFDLTYSDISVDLRTGSVSITDLRAWPLPEWDLDGTCEISADRLTIRSGALDQPERARMKAQAIGVSFPDSCLPGEAREPLALAGLSQIDMPRMTFDVDYGFPSSDAVIRFYGDIIDVAALDLTAEMSYVWFDGRDDIEEPIPVVFLENATLQIENKGIWEAVNGMLPPPITGEGAPLFIEGALGQGLIELNRESGDEDTSLTDAQRAFIGSIVDTWPAFLATPDTLVLETGIDGDIYIDFLAIEDDPRILFDDLKPKVSLVPSRAQDTLPLDLLASVFGSDAALAPEDQKRAGLALLTGIGAPRNLEKGAELLVGLAEQGDGEAAMALSNAMADREPVEAYRFALLAGLSGERGATARLDRLERVLSFEQVLDLQKSLAGAFNPDPSVFASVAQVRDEAAKFYGGKGRARSYGLAAAFAMIGSAAGDPESAEILEQIDEQVRLAGDGAFAVWSETEREASTAAMDAWLDGDLGALYAQ